MIMIPPFMCGIGDNNAADGDDHLYKKEDQEEDDANRGAHCTRECHSSEILRLEAR